MERNRKWRTEKLNIVCLKIIDAFLDKNIAEINYSFLIKNDILNNEAQNEDQADLHQITAERYSLMLDKFRGKIQNLFNINKMLNSLRKQSNELQRVKVAHLNTNVDNKTFKNIHMNTF